MSEDWQEEHRDRWDALVKAGWVFSAPDTTDDLVGITMSLGKDFRTFYAKKSNNFKVIHTKLLTSCEEYANDTLDPERGALPNPSAD